MCNMWVSCVTSCVGLGSLFPSQPLLPVAGHTAAQSAPPSPYGMHAPSAFPRRVWPLTSRPLPVRAGVQVLCQANVPARSQVDVS